ncbi:hypothetical protein GBW32_13310 [Streptomyces tsukubensis]|nr:hypothetical protein GBW32_13310 [Streptomyces tsukubensis]
MPGMLLIRTGDDDDVWDDVLSRMGELPGMRGPGQASVSDAGSETSLPRRLIVTSDPAWRGASDRDVAAALGQPGVWVPDVVLLTDDRTEDNPQDRPLLAYDSREDFDAFWITPRQAAMTYLALHHPCVSWAIIRFVDQAPTDLAYELEEEDEVDEDCFYEPMGAKMEALDNPPRYTRPARALPLLDHKWDLLVRTDFTDDAAWAALLETVSRPAHTDPTENFLDQLTVVNDPAFAGATPEQVLAQVRHTPDKGDLVADVVLIADSAALNEPGGPVLAVPLADDIGLTFRVAASSVGVMLPNLGLSNMDISDWR